jgi:hypothetical protein
MKDRKAKQILARCGYHWDGRGYKERMKDSKHGECFLHSCLKIEQ